MSKITITKEGLERDPLLENRHRLIWRSLEAIVEDEPMPREYQCAIGLIDKTLQNLGYDGFEVDAAAYAETRFQLQDEGVVIPCP